MLLGAFAALVLPSCIKEDVQKSTTGQEYEMVPVTFSAVSEQRAADVNDESADTKVVLKDGSYQWEADTYVSVFTSAAPELNNKYKVLSSGATSDFEGELPAGHAAPYYAVAPYNASNAMHTKVIDNTDGTKTIVDSITVVVPAIQTAVEGSIPPETPFIAKSDNQEFTFKAVTGFVKFTMQMENIKEVTFSGNNNEMLAGTSDVKFGDEGKITNTINKSYPSSPTITLKMSDDGCFEVGKEYYIAIRTFSFDKGITISYLDKDGNRFYRTTTNKPTNSVSRNRYMTLKFKGEMNIDIPNDLFVAWIHGFNIDLGGELYNKTSYQGTVRLIQKDTTLNISKSAIYFIEPDKELSHTSSITNNIFTCRYSNKTAKFCRSDDSYVHIGDGKNVDQLAFCVWHNIVFNKTPSKNAYYFAPNNGCCIDKIVFDGCSVDIAKDYSFLSCPLGNGDYDKKVRYVNSLRMVNNDISMQLNSKLFQILNFKGEHTMETLVFDNNILYCKNDGELQKFLRLLSCQDYSIKSVSVCHNTFGNHYMDGGFINVKSINEAVCTNNLHYFDVFGSNATYYLRVVNAADTIYDTAISENNYSVYKGETLPAKLHRCGYIGNTRGFISKTTEGTDAQDVLDINSADKFNPSKGVFISNNLLYGAQRDWSKYTGAAAN